MSPKVRSRRSSSVYPQIFAHHKRPSEEGQKVALEWGRDKAGFWPQVLNDHYLGKGNNPGDPTWDGGNGTDPGTSGQQTGLNNSAECGNRQGNL